MNDHDRSAGPRRASAFCCAAALPGLAGESAEQTRGGGDASKLVYDSETIISFQAPREDFPLRHKPYPAVFMLGAGEADEKRRE